MSDYTSETPLKRCTKCGEEKPATTEYFHKRNSAPIGLKSRCKACCKLDYDPERRSQKGREYYQTHREEVKLKSRKHYYSNHEGRRKQRQIYYQNNKEKFHRNPAEYRQLHLAQVRANTAVANAVARGKIPAVDTLVCADCGNQARHYHHWSYAPEHRLDVTPLCTSCHGKRHRKY